MKNINILLFLSIIFTISCKAQTIVPLKTSPLDAPENAYYKDLNNELNKFEGTWQYANGNTSFTMVLEKKIKVDMDDYYNDKIVGWYKYIENGQVIINTLLNTNDFYIIYGSNLSDDGKRLIVHFEDPTRPKVSYQVRLDVVSSSTPSIPKLDFKIFQTGVAPTLPGETPANQGITIPKQMQLIKQP
ncbi:MAG: DUF6705 family protein [Flavobacteriaceae bacterium]